LCGASSVAQAAADVLHVDPARCATRYV